MKYEPWELHPTLVHFPIAFFLGAIALDLYAWYRADPERARVATGLLWAGVATAALTALAGVLAMFTGPASHTEESGDLVWWHIGAAVTQFLLFTLVAFVRWRAQPAARAGTASGRRRRARTGRTGSPPRRCATRSTCRTPPYARPVR